MLVNMAIIQSTNSQGIVQSANSGKYVEEYIPVKNILNGMIQLDNGEYVTGIKVSPKNIFIMDQGERDNLIFQLQNFYNMMDFEFWLIVADRPVDISVYLSQLQLAYTEEENPAIRKLIAEDIEKGFGIPVLVSVPLIDNFTNEKGGKK